MLPEQRQEIIEIAGKLERISLPQLANRLRGVLEYGPDPERLFSIQDHSRQVIGIPWGLAELLFPAYGSHGQSLEDLHRRGGFGREELGMLAVDSYSGSPQHRHSYLQRMPLLTLWDAVQAQP